MDDQLAPAPTTRRALRTARSGGGAPAAGRAGRNLPVAIGVGVGLALVVIGSLFIRKEAFVLVVAVASCVALTELTGALRQRGIVVPVVPVVVGTVGMLVSAYTSGSQALAVWFVQTALAVVIWRAAEGSDGAMRDVAGGVFAAAYLPLLASFTMLMLAEDDGASRVLVFALVTTASDIGGYAAGVLTGRHPMAPSVSPKKSWEGFAGSVVACVVVGAVSVSLALDGDWRAGVVVGAAAVLVATLGDLGESMVKRDLGIKDMGSLLPGHGGVMDRLDSLLVSAPVCWVLLHLLVPVMR